MWGTPFGHYSQYDVKMIGNLQEYQIEKQKYL
jgi:hypothetical protein